MSGELALSDRVLALDEEIRGTPRALCAERAVLLTRYFREEAEWSEPMGDSFTMIVKKAGALRYILRNKRIRIYPQELLVGNFTSHRVGGGIFPELHGVAMMEDLFRFPHRSVNPLAVSKEERRQLLREVLPFWIRRVPGAKALPFRAQLRLAAEQIDPKFYLINEIAGISHFVPDYQGLVTRGTEGYRNEAATLQKQTKPGSSAFQFCEAVQIVCDALDEFGGRYREEARRLAREAPDDARREDLVEIADACAWVPRHPPRTFREALQSILFAQISLNIESLDNSVSPGRLDQILGPFYERDLAAGTIDRPAAFELLGCFALKLCEIVPAFSRRGTRFHGGMFNGQVLVVGGTDRQGKDATNEVTYLFLELMDRLRTRQPNYHARLHRESPPAYRLRVASALARGAVSPALYNDEVIVPLLQSRGISKEDARDYANVGCVEPVSAGRSFLSTDAALFNLPICLELALNRGRRFGGLRRIGVATPPAEACRSMDDLLERFRAQVEAGVGRLLFDIAAIERANAKWNPTPLTSMRHLGCLVMGRAASPGVATYNGSGLQGIGVVEVGDSLAAIDWVVFQEKRATLAEVVRACRKGFRGHEALRARLRNAPKYGNDHPLPDGYVGRVMEVFQGCLASKQNTRGGEYVAGFYSVTAHVAFGKKVGALPSGRMAKEPFSSGISPTNGMDRLGPTAAMRSAAALPLHLAQNGVNFNLQLAPWVVSGPDGAPTLQKLIDGGFAAGCMQMQVNVYDPKLLVEARNHPGRYPGLLVRVSGYSAYFDDLSVEMKEEIIQRTLHDAACTRS
jgi:formate C-acetyltransferase